MSVVAETLGVSRSNLHDRLKGRTKPRRRYHKAQDAAVVPLITALVAARPTYGYRRITAILNRQLRDLQVQRLSTTSAFTGSCRGRTCCWPVDIPNGPTAPTTARS